MVRPTRNASWCSPATSSTRCARWACSRASWPPRCRTAPTGQPSYLGTVIHDVPGAGTRSDPDLAGDRRGQARPDPRFGGADPRGLPASCRRSHRRCSPARRAPRGRTTCAPSARRPAGREAADGPDRGVHRPGADQTGADNDAAHFQASVVQFTDTTMRVYGADNFPGSVLADVGVDRPAAQRFTDKPYVEIGISDADLDDSPTSPPPTATSSIVSFASPAAKDRAPAGARQRRVAEAVGHPRQPGVRRQQRGVADRRRASSPPAASSTTCTGSTHRSTECASAASRVH